MVKKILMGGVHAKAHFTQSRKGSKAAKADLRLLYFFFAPLRETSLREIIF